jgi:hypothetical protein
LKSSKRQRRGYSAPTPFSAALRLLFAMQFSC